MNLETDTPTHLQQLIGIFESSRKALARLAARIVKPQDVEDIVQETYVRIFQASQKTRIYRARSFMLQTARNLALNHIARADALNHVLPDHDPGELREGIEETTISAETLTEGQEEFLLFCRAVRELSVECQRAFILRKIHDLPQQEVAFRLGIAESTVEKHVARGITAASEYLRQHGYQRLPRKVRATKTRGTRR
jgi:RNA polymerase sigma factor (sigma-70 family)